MKKRLLFAMIIALSFGIGNAGFAVDLSSPPFALLSEINFCKKAHSE